MRSIRLFAILLGFVVGFGVVGAQPAATIVYLPLLEEARGPSYALNVGAATHLGGTQADSGNAIDVSPDNTLVFGGTMPNYTPPLAPTSLLNGSSGMLLRFARDGRELLSATRIGASVNDLELGAQGEIAVCGDFGIALLDPEATAVIWNEAPGNGKRCAIGSDGTAAMLVGNEALAYNLGGSQLGRWTVGGSAQNDIAVDGVNQLVIVTGYNQVSRDLQLPFIRAYGYDGTLRWKSYDVSAGAPNVGGADTRGERIAIGDDGKLYFAGSINGGTGASIFVRDPKDTSISANDRIVKTDRYTDPFNVGSVKMLWFGRFNPANGELELGQSLLTRRDNGSGNSIGARAITADAQGNVYLAGDAYASMADRSRITISGKPIGSYNGPDAYVLVISPDFTQRYTWVAFNGAGGKGAINALGVGNGIVAVAGTVTTGEFLTHQAIQPTPAGANDGFMAVWE